MPAPTRNDTRLNVRLSAELKTVIEEAAGALGQSVSDFAVYALTQTARAVLREQRVTELSARDRDLFIRLLDDADAKPNRALTDAARRYKKHLGQ